LFFGYSVLSLSLFFIYSFLLLYCSTANKVEYIVFENGWISNFEGLVTLTLTLDRVILHTFVHHSSTSNYMPNFIEIEDTFVD